jgi:hypothetical protein
MGGDIAAGKVLLGYLIGKPAEAVDVDRVDLDELKLLAEAPTVIEDAMGDLRLSPALAAEQARRRRLDDDAAWLDALAKEVQRRFRRERGRAMTRADLIELFPGEAGAGVDSSEGDVS